MFDISDTIIRATLSTDKAELDKMARTVWDGHDYLPKIAEQWISEGGFFVVEYRNRIIGCTKISRFPNGVLWFEGLRVHAKFRGLGIGKLLNGFAFDYAHRLKDTIPNIKYEFCTYYKNYESIHLAQKIGFKEAERFFVIAKRGTHKTKEPELISEYQLSAFDLLGTHIPCGWRAVHNVSESLDWLKARSKLFKTDNGFFLSGGISGNSILALGQPRSDLKNDLPYFQYLYGPRKSIELILPMSWERHIPALISQGFHFWDGESVANMIIFSAI